MRGRFFVVASLPALLAGFGAHRLLGLGPVASVLIGGVVLMGAVELLRVLNSRDY